MIGGRACSTCTGSGCTGHAVALLPDLLPSDPAIHLSELPGSPGRHRHPAQLRIMIPNPNSTG